MKPILTFWKKHLTARMAGTFFLLTLLAVAVVGSLVYMQARRSLTITVYDRLKAISAFKEDSLSHWSDQQRLNLVFVARLPEVRLQSRYLMDSSASLPEKQDAYNTLTDYLQYVMSSVPDFEELFIMDLQGKVVLSTDPAKEGQSHLQTEYFRLGLSNTYVQPFYNSPETGKPAITVATPLFDDDKRRVGVLAGHLNLTRVDQLIFERTGLGVTGEAYLVNPNHQFVSATIFNRLGISRREEIRSPGVDQALKGRYVQGLFTNYHGVPVIGIYTWLEDRDAVLVTELSQSEAFEPARTLAWAFARYGVLAAALLAGAVYLFSRQITHPVLMIAETAERVAAGDLSQEAPVMTSDEVGVLAQTFNHMTGELRTLYASLENKVAERTHELSETNQRLEEEIQVRERAEEQLRSQNTYLAALQDTTLGVISHLDLNDLLETLIERAGEMMHTPHGLIFITSPGRDEIVCRVGLGAFASLVGLRLQTGEGLGGKLLQTGAPLIINDYDLWDDRARAVEPGLIRSTVGVPLKSGGQVIGVISLAYDQQSPPGLQFGQYEIELLSHFARLGVLALENANLYSAAVEARTAAENANRIKSDFLASVSHELRTPLTAIIGFTNIVHRRLKERVFPLLANVDDARLQKTITQVDENLRIVTSEGERLTNLINDLLDLEKIQSGKMSWHMQPLQPLEIIARAEAATSALFTSKGLGWVVDAPEQLPQVSGDRDRLLQVVINLISNAIKFTNTGSITCRVAQADSNLVISIIDEGIGISPADQKLVFEKFKQVGDTLTNKPKGTGLGLSICKEIIEHHGGRIWVDSQPGVGSTFSFSLPVLISEGFHI